MPRAIDCHLSESYIRRASISSISCEEESRRKQRRISKYFTIITLTYTPVYTSRASTCSSCSLYESICCVGVRASTIDCRRITSRGCEVCRHGILYTRKCFYFIIHSVFSRYFCTSIPSASICFIWYGNISKESTSICKVSECFTFYRYYSSRYSRKGSIRGMTEFYCCELWSCK